MSWSEPNGEEPTLKEFFQAWRESRTICGVSRRLFRLNYFDMTPAVCLEWYQNLVGVPRNLLGCRLPKDEDQWVDTEKRKIIGDEEADALEEERRNTTPEQVAAINNETWCYFHRN